MYKVLWFLLVFISAAQAEGVGVSYFAAQGFSSAQCNDALRVFKKVKNPGMAILWKSFDIPGRKLCAQKFLLENKNKKHFFEIHVGNGSGRRFKRLAKYELLPKIITRQLSKKIELNDKRIIDAYIKEAIHISKFLEQYASSKTTTFISTGLEEGLSNKAHDVLSQIFKNNIKQSIIIARSANVPNDNKIHIDSSDFIELHGPTPKFSKSSYGRCIANLDGTNIELSDRDRRQPIKDKISISRVRDYIRQNAKRGCYIFLWWARTQSGDANKFIKPRDRNFRIFSKDVYLINKIILENQK